MVFRGRKTPAKGATETPNARSAGQTIKPLFVDRQQTLTKQEESAALSQNELRKSRSEVLVDRCK